MKKNVLLLFILSLTFISAFSQQLNRPKLVVGIVVDQMRPDYLSRFYDSYGNGGFKTLMADGYTMWNVHYNYIPTATGPGHASIYSGTTPRYHGIVGNDIYYRETKKSEYCVKDTTCFLVGDNNTKPEPSASPRRMIATNICDELKICTNNQSKVISISLKDRAAVLSGGHVADYALWFDQRTGNFVTSTYYTKQLPDWVVKFNKQNLAANYIKDKWTPLLSANNYANCMNDTSIYVVDKLGNKSTFPHALQVDEGSKDAKYSRLYNSPMADDLLTDLAIETIKKANMGKGDIPDFLAISYSSTDAVGHTYGPLSKEIKDTYLRLDKDLERLIQTLDQSVGKGNYVLFLTADHGVAEVPQYLMSENIPAGYMNHQALYKLASDYLNSILTPGKWIETLFNDQFYLNRELIAEKGLNLKTIQTQLADFLVKQKGIAFAFTASEMNENEFTTNEGMRVQNGFQPKRSGDVMFIMEPAYFEGENNGGTTHGTSYTYDTNVPLIWYGQNIKKGESWQLHYITDLAPTLSMILRVKYPNACIGNPILEINGSK